MARTNYKEKYIEVYNDITNIEERTIKAIEDFKNGDLNHALRELKQIQKLSTKHKNVNTLFLQRRGYGYKRED